MLQSFFLQLTTFFSKIIFNVLIIDFAIIEINNNNYRNIIWLVYNRVGETKHRRKRCSLTSFLKLFYITKTEKKMFWT